MGAAGFIHGAELTYQVTRQWDEQTAVGSLRARLLESRELLLVGEGCWPVLLDNAARRRLLVLFERRMGGAGERMIGRAQREKRSASHEVGISLKSQKVRSSCWAECLCCQSALMVVEPGAGRGGDRGLLYASVD